MSKIDLKLDEMLGHTSTNVWPKRYATGPACPPRRGMTGKTRVPVGDGYFYVLPPGKAISPYHDELIAAAKADAPAKAVPAPAVRKKAPKVTGDGDATS